MITLGLSQTVISACSIDVAQTGHSF